MNLNNRSKGALGELIASRYLEKKGYTLLKMNYWLKFGEIDLIMLDADYIVFIEVKMRYSLETGRPVEAITKKKQRTIRKIANAYWLMGEWKNKQPRFDVIEVLVYGEKKIAIKHIINAF